MSSPWQENVENEHEYRLLRMFQWPFPTSSDVMTRFWRRRKSMVHFCPSTIILVPWAEIWPNLFCWFGQSRPPCLPLGRTRKHCLPFCPALRRRTDADDGKFSFLVLDVRCRIRNNSQMVFPRRPLSPWLSFIGHRGCRNGQPKVVYLCMSPESLNLDAIYSNGLRKLMRDEGCVNYSPSATGNQPFA